MRLLCPSRWLPAALAPAVLLLLSGAPGAGSEPTDEPPEWGAYCPLPEPGETPACLQPAQAQYREFFAAVETGAVDEGGTAAVEADLRAGRSERAYLALSSLSYGYWRLAEAVANAPEADPALLARLQRWNELLLALYDSGETDPRLRAAVREAATDLHRRAPPVGESCRPDQACTGTEALVQALAAIDANAGLRSPLEQLMQRMWREDAADAPTRPANGSR